MIPKLLEIFVYLIYSCEMSCVRYVHVSMLEGPEGEAMERLVAGVVEYAPLVRYPSETFCKYVQRNVTEYERILEEAVKKVCLIFDVKTNK